MTRPDVDSNAPATFPDWLSHQAERRGPQIALRQKLRGIWASWSWRALDDDVSRVQQALAARGLVPGDRVVIHSDPLQSELCPELIVLGLAAQRGGAAVAFVEAVGRGAQPESRSPSPRERGSALPPAPWPRFVVVRDAAALAELPPEPAPAFELRILLTGRGFVPGAQPGVVLYEALLRERRGASPPESGTVPRRAREGDVACVVTASALLSGAASSSARGQRSADSSPSAQAHARTHRELIAAAGALARSLGDDVDHDTLALGTPGAAWQFCNVVGPWLLLGFRLNLVEDATTADYDRRELGPSLLLGSASAYRQLAQRVHASLPPPDSWLRRALERLLDARPGSLSAWVRSWLVLRPLRDVLGVSRVRQALVLGAPPEAALSSELRRWGISIDVLPSEAVLARHTTADDTAADADNDHTASVDTRSLQPSARAVA
jgi:hypothetical protein